MTLLAIPLFFACSESIDFDRDFDQELTQEIPAMLPDAGTFVSEEMAAQVADLFFSGKFGGITDKKRTGTLRSSASIETLKDEDKPLMYVLNYPEGGFVIVSATRSYFPVLAYSDEGSFIMSPDMGPAAVWLEETQGVIKACETLDDSTKLEIRGMWSEFKTADESIPTGSMLRSYDPLLDQAIGQRMPELRNMWDHEYAIFTTLEGAQDFFPLYANWLSVCNFANSLGSPPEYTIFVAKYNYSDNKVGPLLATQWHQNAPFNNLCPQVAGCAAVAVAQTMKYYHHPQLFNWNNIPINPLSSSDQAVLIRNAADAVKTKWGVFGIGNFSWALPGDVESGIRSYGYTVTRAKHNYQTVWGHVNHHRPVIMGGGTVDLPNPLNYLGNGHYWVCDGVHSIYSSIFYFLEFIDTNSYTYYSNPFIYNPSNPIESYRFSRLYFHMNWGWRGDPDSKNGWFLNYDVNSGSGNFQHGREDFYIIKP
jgi:hypothetical protein